MVAQQDFQEIPTYSNVGPEVLERRLEEWEKYDAIKRPLIQEGIVPEINEEKGMVLIERNSQVLSGIAQVVRNAFQASVPPQERWSPIYPHHTTREIRYFQLLNGSPVSQIEYRLKGGDSSVEKLTRIYAQEKRVESRILPGHISVEDVIGFRLVCLTGDDCRKAREIFSRIPKLQMVHTEDFLANPKESGYRAIHDTFRWHGRRGRGAAVKVRYVPEEDFHYQHGHPNSSARSRNCYMDYKLNAPHKQGDYLILVTEKGKPEGAEPRVRFIDNGRFGRYFLMRTD